MSCILIATHLQLLQDRLVSKHLSFQMVLNFNTLFLGFSSGIFFLNLDLAQP